MRLFVMLAAATATTAAPSAGPVTLAEVAVPRNHGPQQVVVQTREFAGHAASGWHRHPGIEIATVTAGEIELHTATGVLRLQQGESFTVPRGAAHNGVNPAGTPAALVITLVVDKGKPLREPVAAPSSP